MKIGVEGPYLNLIKHIYGKIILKWEKNESISSKIKNKSKMSTLTILVQYSIQNLAREMEQETKMKEIQIEKEEVKASLFAET